MSSHNEDLSKDDLPEWIKSVSKADELRYIHSHQCKICRLEVGGRYIRQEIEIMRAVENKKLIDICAIIKAKYNKDITPSNISNHMKRHCPNYMEVTHKILAENFEDIVSKRIDKDVDQFTLWKIMMNIGAHNILKNPDEVKPRDADSAAKHYHDATEGILLNIPTFKEEELVKLVEVVQRILTPEQRILFNQMYIGDQAAIEGEIVDAEYAEIKEIDGVVIPENIPYADDGDESSFMGS